MRAFAEHYKDLSFVQAVLAQIPPNNKTPSLKRKKRFTRVFGR
jgi:hypothetical protein